MLVFFEKRRRTSLELSESRESAQLISIRDYVLGLRQLFTSREGSESRSVGRTRNEELERVLQALIQHVTIRC